MDLQIYYLEGNSSKNSIMQEMRKLHSMQNRENEGRSQVNDW